MTVLKIRGPNPIWFMMNHTAEPLDDTYWVFFKANTLPYSLQSVYQSPNGTPWPNPMEFQPSAGLPNNLYFSPELVYRIEIRQGDHDSDPLIWLIENYIPGDTQGGSTDTDSLLTAENLLTNPQFADIYFSSPLTISTAGTYDIAPGWQLELVGTGTVSTTITQGTTAGTDEDIGNPAYYLRFQNSGWTSATLFQRLANNGSLFAQGAVGIAFSAFATSNEEQLPVYYTPSDAGTAKLFLTADVQTGGFQQFGNAIELPVSTNTATGTAGYVDIRFALPGESDISISNVQFTGQNNSLIHSPLTPVYQEISYARMVDHEFNVYRDSIILQPKDSLLTGWNFALNPWQFTTTTLTNVAVNQYTADQTIVVQQAYVTSATGNNVAVGKADAANNLGFEVKAITAHNEFAIIQYIDVATISPYWGSIVSSLVRAYITTSHSTSCQFKMRLISIQSAPSSTAQNYPIISWTENGDPVFHADFEVIIPPNDPVYTLTDTPTEFAFNGFQMPGAGSATQFLGVVLYTVSNMNQNATADLLFIQDISLVPNRFALSSNPKTFDQSLKECEYYYASTFLQGVVPAQAAGITGTIGYYTFASGVHDNGVVWQYPSLLRTASPIITTYNPISANANWYNHNTSADSGVPAIVVYSNKNLIVSNPQVGGDNAISQLILIHLSVDGRLG